MPKIRAILFCGPLAIPAMASAEDFAPVALNSLSAPPSNIVSLQVMNQKGQVIGQALRIQTDQNGKPAALAFHASNGSTVVIPAAATSYDGHVLIACNNQPQIAALSAVPAATN